MSVIFYKNMVALSVDWAPIALRIILGIIFIMAGYPKLKDLKGTGGFLAGLGFKPGVFWAFILGIAEFFGGIAILIGLFSRIGSGVLFISMLVALYVQIFVWKTPFQSKEKPGYMADVLILIGLLTVFLLGSGTLSFDQVIGWTLG